MSRSENYRLQSQLQTQKQPCPTVDSAIAYLLLVLQPAQYHQELAKSHTRQGTSHGTHLSMLQGSLSDPSSTSNPENEHVTWLQLL